MNRSAKPDRKVSPSLARLRSVFFFLLFCSCANERQFKTTMPSGNVNGNDNEYRMSESSSPTEHLKISLVNIRR